MKNETKFVQFPLFLMRNIFIDRIGTISDIIHFGVYWFSKKISYTLTDVSRQIIFEIYRGELSEELEEIIYNMEWEFVGQDPCCGFNGCSFIPEPEIEEFTQVLETNPILKERSIEHYQVHSALSLLKLVGYIPTYIVTGKEIENKMLEKEPMPMISIAILKDFRDNKKSEFQIIQLAGYIAVRSIIGPKRTLVRTNKQFIVCRMFGYSTSRNLPLTMNSAINDLFQKYSKRYHIDRVLNHLELNWNILNYSNQMRGMYIALGWKIKIQDLALIAEKSKSANRIKEIKRAKIDAREIALQQLNKGR